MDRKIDGQDLARERKNLFMFAMMRLRDPDLAEDAVQETLVAALRSLDGFAQRSSLRTWLISILINKMSDLINKRRQEVPVDELIDSDIDEESFDEHGHWEPEAAPRTWSSPEKALEQSEFWGVFEGCLQMMPPRTGEVFVMREVMGESIADICHTLDISESNCSVILFRARANLRGCLEQKWFQGAQ